MKWVEKIRQVCRSPISEISTSLELRLFGTGLAITHIVTYFFWFRGNRFLLASSQNVDPICWSFLPNCASWKFLSVQNLTFYGYAYLTLAFVSMLFFFRAKTVTAGWAGLIILTTMKLFVFWQDYRMMGNYHYMVYLATFVFLFIPGKSWTLRWLIVGFYLAAGALKLNYEWLSGSAIPSDWIPMGTPPYWVRENGFLPLSCAYVLILETLIVFGLMSRRRWIFWSTFAQFIAFHVFSYWIVGWFYPAVMSCLIPIFVIHRFWGQEKDPLVLRHRFGALFLIMFSLSQIIPMVSSGSPALTGEGRIYALNMFDSLTVCYSKSFARVGQRIYDVSESSQQLTSGVRIQCDPYIYFQRAKRWCKIFAMEPGFSGISLNLVTRTTTAAAFREIVALDNICHDDIQYSSFFPNAWVHE